MSRAIAVVLWLATPARADTPEQLRPAIALAFPDVRWIDAPTLARWRGEGAPIVLLDARTEGEVRVSHLAGAVRVDPDREDLSGLALPPEARVIVYCSVGWRSAAVAERLARVGHRRVFNLEGGIFGWANAGRPVYRGGARVRSVHPYDAIWGRMLERRLHAYAPLR